MNIKELKEAAEALRDGAGQYLGKDYAEHRRAFQELTGVAPILSLIERHAALESALYRCVAVIKLGFPVWDKSASDALDMARAALETPAEEVANADPR